MTLNLIGMDGESETMIKIKIWHVLVLIITALVAIGGYLYNHHGRLCEQEKQSSYTASHVTELKSSTKEMHEKIDRMYREQDMYFSLREPRWNDWKKIAERNGNGKK